MICRPCLDCATPTRSGSRCPACEAERQRRRNRRRTWYSGSWPRISRDAIDAHVATVGLVCAGYRVAAHPVERRDLTCDHHADGELGVLCRSCNARKGALAPVFGPRGNPATSAAEPNRADAVRRGDGEGEGVNREEGTSLAGPLASVRTLPTSALGVVAND